MANSSSSQKKPHIRNIPGTSRLDLFKVASAPHQRRRYSPERRDEVHAMRKLGACLKCRLKKKPCSDGEVCKLCAEGIDKKQPSPFSWLPCVRPSILRDLETRFDKETLEFVQRARSADVLPGWTKEITEQDFFIPAEWDRLRASSDTVDWEFTINHRQVETQKVRILTATEMSDVVTKHLSPGVGGLASFYIRACAVLYHQRCGEKRDDPSISPQGLEKALLYAGACILQEADSCLYPKKWGPGSSEVLNCLFICLMVISRTLDFMVRVPNDNAGKQPSETSTDPQCMTKTLARLTDIYALTIGERLEFLENAEIEKIMNTLEPSSWNHHCCSYRMFSTLEGGIAVVVNNGVIPKENVWLGITKNQVGFTSTPTAPAAQYSTVPPGQFLPSQYAYPPVNMLPVDTSMNEFGPNISLQDVLATEGFNPVETLDSNEFWPLASPTTVDPQPMNTFNQDWTPSYLGQVNIAYPDHQEIHPHQNNTSVRVTIMLGNDLTIRFTCPLPTCSLQYSSLRALKAHLAHEHHGFIPHDPSIGPQPLEPPTTPQTRIDCPKPHCFRKGEFGFLQQTALDEHEWCEHRNGEGRRQGVRKALSLLVLEDK